MICEPPTTNDILRKLSSIIVLLFTSEYPQICSVNLAAFFPEEKNESDLHYFMTMRMLTAVFVAELYFVDFFL